MKFKAKRVIHCSDEFDGFEYYGTIPEGYICEVKLFENYPAIFYKGKAVCDPDSQMVCSSRKSGQKLPTKKRIKPT